MGALVNKRETCRLCDSSDLVLSVPLAKVPIVSPNVGVEDGAAGQRLAEIVAPLDTYLCRNCGLIQLVHVVDSTLIYRDYLYRTSVSLGLADHFAGLAERVIARLGLVAGDLVVEFGSNDGTLLGFFKSAGLRVHGVDPARQIAAEATARGIPTTPDFFTPDVARAIVAADGPAKAVIANNAMANIDDLGQIFTGVATLLAPDGGFVFETQYALDVFEKMLLDVIYHEHISTFSVRPVARAAPEYGLAMFDAERIATKGGSIRFWLGHAAGPWPAAPAVGELADLEQRSGLYDLAYHRRFADKVEHIRDRLHHLIDDARAGGGLIGAYGTSVGSAALIHQLSLEGRIDALIDDNPFKDHLVGPGYDLPVLTTEGVYELEPALIVILAWRYATRIIAKHQRYLDAGGRFIVPLPELQIVP